MKKNLSLADRIIRILIAVVVGILYFTNQISGTTAIILLVIAGILILTGLISFCPLYFLLGLSTKKKQG